jgi:hypothetical protein
MGRRATHHNHHVSHQVFPSDGGSRRRMLVDRLKQLTIVVAVAVTWRTLLLVRSHGRCRTMWDAPINPWKSKGGGGGDGGGATDAASSNRSVSTASLSIASSKSMMLIIFCCRC